MEKCDIELLKLNEIEYMYINRDSNWTIKSIRASRNPMSRYQAITVDIN